MTLPLTYIPVLVVANDQEEMGEHANGRLANGIGSVFAVFLTVVSLAALPLFITTTIG